MGAYEQANYSLGSVDPIAGTKPDLKKLMDSAYTGGYAQNSIYWTQGIIDKRMKAGDQAMNNMIYGSNEFYTSKRYFFNLIRKHSNMICGFQRRNRKSTVALPIRQDDAVADDYNAMFKYCEEKDGFQEYFSEAFEGGVDVGMSLLHMYLDYSYDSVSGDLCTDQIAFSNFLIDPYWRKMDFSDCRYIWIRIWVSKERAMAILPQRQKEIEKLRPPGTSDGRFQYQAELLNKNGNDLYPMDYFYYRDMREAKVILDPYTQESVLWEETAEDEEGDLAEILQQQPWLKVTTRKVPTVSLGICISGKEMYHGPNLLGTDSYPFVPMVSYYDADLPSYLWRCQGIIRNARDAQFLYNLRKVIELDIMQSQVTSGWIYPVDVLTDPKALRQSGQGYVIPIKAGRSVEEIKRIDPPAIPQSMIELTLALGRDITEIIGATEELMGSSIDDQSGILNMVRQAAGLTGFQGIFDKADYSQRLYGKLRLQAVRKKYTRRKVRSILGREPHPDFFRANTLNYNIAVEQGSYSTTQRQAELQQLLHFKQLGINIPDKAIIQAAFITNKKQLIEDMQQDAQAQQQMQQQQMQLEQQKEQSDMQLKQSKSQDNLASAQEKLARIDELHSSAEHQRTEADLNLIKILVGLDSMELDNLKRNFELAEAIKISHNTQMSKNNLQETI